MMYGQMTAGSWIYIGTQGILQGTYETLAALAVKKGWPSLKGKFVLTAGLGGMGGAQPLAITMNEGVGLIVEVDPARARRRQQIGYVDVVLDSLEEAMTLVEESLEKEEPKSIALVANAAEIYPELYLRGVIPDVVTDQTPAHDISMYIPAGLDLDQAAAFAQFESRRNMPRQSVASMSAHVRAMLDFKNRVPRYSITATISASAPMMAACRMLSNSQASSLPISARFSARARVPSAGWHFPATRRISTAPMQQWRSSFLRMTTCSAG